MSDTTHAQTPLQSEESLLANSGSGLRAGASVVAFLLSLVGVFVYLGWYVTDLQGGGVAAIASGVSPERGEAIFWGKGTCHTCHSVGSRGNMKRCPNLGESEIGPPIGERASLRAAQRAKQTGQKYTRTDYLVECISTPSAYLVEGFPDKLMPIVYTGQVDLEAEEVMSVIAYLQTVGGEMDLEALAQSMSRFGQAVLQKERLGDTAPAAVAFDLPYPEWEVMEPEQFVEYHKIAGDEARVEYRSSSFDEEQKEIYDEIVEEWIEEGEDIFQRKKCWQCHTIAGKDFGAVEPGNIGPDLTSIGAIQTREYIMESILTPDALIVPPVADHSSSGRSKMPSYSEQLGVSELMRLVTFLSAQTRTTATADTGTEGQP